ncbi:MBL fold metallo-hydrolase [Mucilaginibacter aquaedulcis]|uniref:MBL fold metallo-hydrolase n=1 Tax=Mucilaginibacter aquaedulcis TaxID=1187081 RepID=UPI0025B3275B|nr:MBL fold metallo-hydrolase [Mucilaginibacter aquaedulcis]MDN3546952.1 MBL fold metallo-hydrolase [Mucilaginibacter aquaedulcis]
MESQKLYLRSNVIAQPLFQGWYAWAYLISPATAAMNIESRHVKIMQSYIQAPAIHAAACKDPKMTGGPFMDYGGKRVDEVKALLKSTLEEQGYMVALSQAIKELTKMLKQEAKGYSIEALYEKVPEVLRGYVELFYDLSNAPGFRFIEPLLYHSKYYNDAFQSISLSLIDDDHRPFVLSTPVLEDADKISINLPFKSKALDEFFSMNRQPKTFEEICHKLKIEVHQKDLFRSFFTEEEPEPYSKYTGEGARLRYFGHACLLLETQNLSILADPVISYGYDAEVSRYTYGDLPDIIDYVLVTHNHQDHVLLESLLKLRHRIKNIVIPGGGGGSLQDPSLRLILESIGFNNVIELRELETLNLDGLKITGIPFLGEHCDLDIRTKLAHLVEINNKKILFAADSCNIEPNMYRLIHEITGDVDVLFLGMECDGAPMSWLYGPLLSEDVPRDKDHSRRLAGSNYQRGIDIVNRFNFSEVYVYAMGMEPWLKYIMAYEYTDDSNPIVASNQLLDECKSKGLRAERLFGEKEILYTTNPVLV